MRHVLFRRALIVLLAASLAVVALHSQGAPGQPTAVDQPPPKDLRPLLTPRASEMRLVTARYTLDRGTLSGNYLGGGRPERGPNGQSTPAEPLSPNGIARLKRFDLDWQAALAALDTAVLSPAARADLDALQKIVKANLEQLDADATALARLAPLVAFAPAIVQLVEARIRLDDINPQKAAGVLTDVTKQIGRIRAQLETGLASNPAADALRVPKDVAQRGPAAVETLRSALTEWFTFYNGYDPLFTWWNGLPFKKADAALQSYAAFLKDKVAVAEGAPASMSSPASSATMGQTSGSPGIAPAPAAKFASVPDLKELLALPQDEMTDIVQRFRGPAAAGRRGGRGEMPPPEAAAGARGATLSATTVPGGVGAPRSGLRSEDPARRPSRDASPAPSPERVARDRTFHEGWLKALKTIEFDKLSRNAQVDYLFIRRMAELQIARIGQVLPETPPRKEDASGIPGKARGRQGLINDLQDELIPYTPEELIAIAEKEFAWCDVEVRKASQQMGFGDDWKRAQEKVKGMHPPPGGQVAVIRDLMFEAVEYLRAHDLMTVPAVAAESLHMIMMTPERQLVNPFFTGGSEISVSYPTDTMDYEARLQSMRGNNTPFSHATAFHEMIPGHNLVFYTTARFRGYRPSLGGNSPFYGEGWPLYWELTMYDMGFHDTPEKRIGALFWRMHRCARIIFSLKFHMGEWSPQECVDFLVDRVGFERDNAIGEVRRSFQGGYGPLYQAAYLLGGIQLRGLRREIVDGGVMGEKAFHDEVLRQGAMPITLLRLVLTRQKLTRDIPIDWRFYDGK
jgi:hypothetical protein